MTGPLHKFAVRPNTKRSSTKFKIHIKPLVRKQQLKKDENLWEKFKRRKNNGTRLISKINFELFIYFKILYPYTII